MKKKKDFFQELRDRNVWREIKAYLFGGATIIPLAYILQPIVGYSNEVGIIIFIIFFSLFPSVFLFAYHHGESREAPWSKAEKIGIPANILITLFLVLFFYNNSVTATETKTELIENLETGELEEIEVVKKEYRKKLYLSFFENTSNDTTLNWLEYAFPTAIRTDLQQDKYINPLRFSRWQIEEKDDSYKYGNKVSFSTYLQIAREKLFPYFIEGSFTKINDKFEITTILWITKTGKALKERKFEGNNFFKLIDEISISIKEDLGLSQEYIENAEDFPVSAYLTESFLAYEYYIKSITYNFNIEETTIFGQESLQRQTNLLNKAIAIDNNFALAYSSCLWKYDRMANRKDSVELYWQKVMQKIHKFQENRQYSLKYQYLKRQGKMAEGVKLLNNWAKKYPDDQEPHESLASYYREKKEWKNAVDEYKKALSIDETDYGLYSSIAWMYSELEDFKNAIKWRKKSAKIYSDDSNKYNSIARLYKQIREIDSAIYYYKEALTLEPSDLWINRSLHSIEIARSGNLELESDYLLDYAKDKDDSISFAYMDAYKYWLYGKIEKYKEITDSIDDLYENDRSWGIPEWDKLQEEEEDYSLLLATGKKDKVKEQLKKAKKVLSEISSGEKYGETAQGFTTFFTEWTGSTVYMHDLYTKEDKKQIEEHLNYLIEKEEEIQTGSFRITFGNNKERIRLQAKVYTLNDEYDKAIALLEEHKHIASNDDYIIQLARYYHKVKNYKKAEENFNLIFRTDPYDPELNYYAALLYHDWGKIEKAKEKLNIALDIWENADKDYVLANKVKEAAQEWGIIDILP
jgi:tetratricopeptide (TPR) repeat protein